MARILSARERDAHERAMHRRFHSFRNRAVFAIAIVGTVLVVGTVGFHLIEGYSYIDSFYFVSMLATAEGPATTPATALGKIFASAIAFVSVGSVIFALAFLFGPFIGKLISIEGKELEKEEKRLEKEL